MNASSGYGTTNDGRTARTEARAGAARSHRLEHEQHGRRGPLRDYPAADRRHGRAAMLAGLGRGHRAGALRRARVGGAGGSHAGRRRQLSVPARGLPPHAAGHAAAISVHLAIHLQRAARDRFRLHRLRAILELSPQRHGRVGNAPGRPGGGCGGHRAALPRHPVRRPPDGGAMTTLLACTVVKTRWPVSAELMAIWAVSWSRISPTMILSGSWRRMERRPRAKVRPFFSLTGIWVMPLS